MHSSRRRLHTYVLEPFSSTHASVSQTASAEQDTRILQYSTGLVVHPAQIEFSHVETCTLSSAQLAAMELHPPIIQSPSPLPSPHSHHLVTFRLYSSSPLSRRSLPPQLSPSPPLPLCLSLSSAAHAPPPPPMLPPLRALACHATRCAQRTLPRPALPAAAAAVLAALAATPLILPFYADAEAEAGTNASANADAGADPCAAISASPVVPSTPRPSLPEKVPARSVNIAAPPPRAPSPSPPVSAPAPVPPPTPSPSSAPPSVRAARPAPLLARYAVADAVEKVIPSVVNIRRVVSHKKLSSFLFDEADVVEVSCGSGFFISADGHILTNTHVVTDRGWELARDQDEDSFLHVTLSTGETYVARILAADYESDIAIVKVNVDAPVPVARLGDSDAVRAGEFVVAVGSPLTLSNSCSFGIISTIHRDLAASTGEASGGLTYLQLDVAINQGSSGGPCVSLDGEVVGICSMKIAGNAEGIGFAIPIKYAQKVVDDLRTHGYVRRPFVGLTLISVTPDLFEDIRRDTNYRPPRWLEAEMRATNSSKSVGLMVHNIARGGPGERAGLKAGDVVVAVNGATTTTTSEFLAALNFQVHKDCVLKVRRGASGVLEKITIRPDVLAPHSRMR